MAIQKAFLKKKKKAPDLLHDFDKNNCDLYSNMTIRLEINIIIFHYKIKNI